MYTYETQWPSPFASGWLQSKLRFHDIEGASKALADWLRVAFENDVKMEGRLVNLENEPK